MPKGQKRWLASFWALTVVVHFVVVMVTKAEEPEDIVFYDDYNKAIQEAKLTQKPIFLEFRCAP